MEEEAAEVPAKAINWRSVTTLFTISRCNVDCEKTPTHFDCAIVAVSSPVVAHSKDPQENSQAPIITENSCDATADWKNHGTYVSCAAKTHPDRAVISVTARSDVGKLDEDESASPSPSVSPLPTPTPKVSFPFTVTRSKSYT